MSNWKAWNERNRQNACINSWKVWNAWNIKKAWEDGKPGMHGILRKPGKMESLECMEY